MFIFELIGAYLKQLRPRKSEVGGRSRTRAVGDAAEEFALAFLKKQSGFRLIQRGMMDEDGELDLVGRVKGNEGLVVVEVRARKEGGLLTPREAVDIKKQRQVVETARRLLPRKGFHDVLRFDVVGVYLNDRDEPTRAEHFENAFDGSVLRRR
ncbi:MAG: YraN family protein [Planctomycetes bacterium]|nr:YraN family protein [Planctomycetota bacterium]